MLETLLIDPVHTARCWLRDADQFVYWGPGGTRAYRAITHIPITGVNARALYALASCIARWYLLALAVATYRSNLSGSIVLKNLVVSLLLDL